mgnify:FL=1
MKMPNGYGSVYKLSGNRRKPWAARVTDGWVNDTKTKKSKQKYKFIGFYETRKEALLALADYNANPYNIDTANITFQEVYERWNAEHFPTVSESNVKGYKAAFLLCAPIAGRRFVDVKLDDLQACADNSGKNYPTLRKYKVLLGLMYKYAVIHEIIPKERNTVEYVNIKKAGNPNAYNRKPFLKTEVKKIWDVKDSNIYYTVILMLIYTGCRIGELLDLKKEDVNLEDRYFKIIASKTAAGIRTAPIAEKVYPLFEYWYNLNDCEYLLSTPEGEHFKYRNYYDSYWSPLIETLGMKHRPHDTRHTCISMLTVAGVSDKVIKKIVGHKGQGVTEVVYTHFEIEELIDAINKI